jgi:hypothetical protein
MISQIPPNQAEDPVPEPGTRSSIHPSDLVRQEYQGVELVQRYSKFPSIARFPSSSPMTGVPIERTGRSTHRVHNVRKRLGSDVISQLIADYEAGASTPALMKRYKISKGTVLRLLQSHGITMRHQQMTDAEITEAIQLYQQGWSLAQVGEKLGRNPSTIQGVLERAGVPRRGRQARERPIG